MQGVNKNEVHSKTAVVFPDKYVIIEVAEIFFEKQYKGIFPFIHKPSLLSFLKSGEFDPKTYIHDYSNQFFKANYANSLKYPDPILLLAILGLCSRLHPTLSQNYNRFSELDSPEYFQPSPDLAPGDNSHFETSDVLDSDDDPSAVTRLKCASNASNYFGWHARNLLKDVFDSPTIQRIQSLTLLSSHEWGEGNNSRSYLYIGIVARMALILGLGNENNLQNDDVNESIETNDVSNFISVECKRRTVWSIYMMDRCNSSGRDRSSAIKIEDIKIKLPSDEKDFIFGNQNHSLTYNQALQYVQNNDLQGLNNISIHGFIIVLFEIWSKIAKWVCEIGGKLEVVEPWDSSSAFARLSNELNFFQSSLPRHLIYNRFNFEAHISQASAACYGYLHGLLLLCRIFLNREYFFCDPGSLPCGWWKSSTSILLKSIDQLSTLLKTLHQKEMVVIAPFTGFEVFTIAATSLYFCAFPSSVLQKHFTTHLNSTNVMNADEVVHIKQRYKRIALENMILLKTWSNVWELGRKWYSLAVHLEDVFGNCTSEESSSIQNDSLRRSMHDYGNGKVREVYNPKNVAKTDIQTPKLADFGNFSITENSGDNSLISPVWKPDKPDVTTNFEQMSTDETFLDFISSPALTFIDNFDTASIFPGWNDNNNT